MASDRTRFAVAFLGRTKQRLGQRAFREVLVALGLVLKHR